MRPAWCIVTCRVFAVVVNGTFGGSVFENDRVERETRTLWSHRDAVLGGDLGETGHQTFAERNRGGRMGVTTVDDLIEAPFAGREAERVGVESASVNRFAGNDLGHRFLGAAECGEGSAATDCFA